MSWEKIYLLILGAFALATTIATFTLRLMDKDRFEPIIVICDYLAMMNWSMVLIFTSIFMQLWLA